MADAGTNDLNPSKRAVATFKSYSGTLKSVEAFSSNVDNAVEKMLAFMNSEECGPVDGVSLTCDFPGYIEGVVLHGGSKGVVSKTWASAIAHEKQPGMLKSRDNAKGGFDAAVQKVLQHPAASTATFATVCSSERSSHAVLFSPDATEQKSKLEAETFVGKMDSALGAGYGSPNNMTGAVTDLGQQLAAVLSTKEVVDISVSSTDTGAYGAVWFRGGASAGSKVPSTVQVVKTGVVSPYTFHQCMDVLIEKLTEYKGPIFFDLAATTVVTHGLVFHEDGNDQPPAFNVGTLPGADGCCTIA